jgi:hypothetical protein
MISPDSPLSIATLRKTGAAFAVERQVAISELSQSIADKEKIAAALLLCLSFLVGQTLDDVIIEKLDRIYPAKRNQGTIDFKIICRVPAQISIDLGICILTTSDFEVASEACVRLLAYKDFGLDRLCLLRPSDLITNVQQLPTCLPKLLSPDIGGNFVPLKAPDLLELLVILSVFQHRQQHGLTNEAIFAYVWQQEFLTKNFLIKSILLAAQC